MKDTESRRVEDGPGDGGAGPNGALAPSRRVGAVVAGALAVVCLLVPLALLAVGTSLGVGLSVLLGLAALAVPFAWSGLGLRGPRWGPWAVFLPALALACYSVLSGFDNGLTDEPYAMPAFFAVLAHGQDPYATAISVTYTQYGAVHALRASYVYLPVLLVAQPFIVSYRWFAVACWAATVLLVRRRPVAMVALGQAFVGLVAASGFNDLPVLLLLTLGYVGIGGRRQRWARWLALGSKQFANVFAVAYHLVRRELRALLEVVLVSLAFALPFLLWDPGSFVCGAVLLKPVDCQGSAVGVVVNHVNYWVWPVWGVAVYFEPLRAALRKALGRGRPGHDRGGGERGASAED